MTRTQRQAGFSLIEVLMAVTTLAVGMLFVGGTFVLGVHYTTLNTEKTYGALVSEQAFATIRLYGVDYSELASDELTRYESGKTVADIPDDAFLYDRNSQYRWEALLQPLGGRLVRVTVLVLRWTGDSDPVLISEDVTVNEGLYVDKNNNDQPWSLRNYVVDGDSRIFQVVRARSAGRPDHVWEINPPLDPNAPDADLKPETPKVYMFAPQAGTGRRPCIAAYQTDMTL